MNCKLHEVPYDPPSKVNRKLKMEEKSQSGESVWDEGGCAHVQTDRVIDEREGTIVCRACCRVLETSIPVNAPVEGVNYETDQPLESLYHDMCVKDMTVVRKNWTARRRRRKTTT